MLPLPIDDYLPQILDAARSRRALILSAAPGAGKTTRVPPALAVDGPVIVLQPRRVAARAMARRIAAEQNWILGREVGWHVRFERQFTADTRVLFATEGILTARLQQDPLLSAFRTIVLDEFHERSIQGDLGLALARQAWLARDDLRIVIMSATLQAAPLAAFLGDAPQIEVPGRLYPIQIDYRPSLPLAAAVKEIAADTDGAVLCFLPGAPEINRAIPDVRQAAGPDVEVVPLHGSLPPDEQDRAVSPASGRRIILATNIAETSLTVPDVTAVIDTGLQKVARYDEDRGIDSLDVERISTDSADQRAGRAGRLRAGRVIRLWDRADRLHASREAEIHRVDLSDTVLAILGWGGDPASFEWFEAPDPSRVAAALSLLEALGATSKGRITPLGDRMKRLPLHPRLGRMLIASGGTREVALACALLSDRHSMPRHAPTTTSDLLVAGDAEHALPPHTRDVARRLQQMIEGRDASTASHSEAAFLRAILAGYPDRIARRRQAGSPRFLLASGHGAVLGRDSGVRNAEFVVAVDVTAGRRGEGAEATIRIASEIDPAWLADVPAGSGLRATRVDHETDASGRVRATARDMYGAIVLSERPAAVDPDVAARLLAAAYRARPPSERDAQLLRRLRFAGLAVDLDALLSAATAGRRALDDVDIHAALSWDVSRDLDRLAPASLAVPSGRTTRLRYEEDGTVVASVKLQELFGLAESPRLGPARAPVVFELLAPNGRPVQTTRDLRSFWNSAYQDVRKELRGRYPRHPWPEDPWEAPPTHRTKPR